MDIFLDSKFYGIYIVQGSSKKKIKGIFTQIFRLTVRKRQSYERKTSLFYLKDCPFPTTEIK